MPPLDRSLLHVFVAGPGYGEGIAVALPHSGWLVLDGCRVSTVRLPILAILDRWRSSTEPVEALLLTHPHTDHAFGIRETMEGTSPRRIGRADFLVNGFRNAGLFQVLHGAPPLNPAAHRRRSRAVTRRIRLLRAHGLVHKRPKSHRYVVSPKGHRIISALLAAYRANTLNKLAT